MGNNINGRGGSTSLKHRHGDRGPAGAVMCETRDLGIKWPQWHTLLFEGQVAVDVSVVCPQDVKNLFLKQASTVYWKVWAAKHE